MKAIRLWLLLLIVLSSSIVLQFVLADLFEIGLFEVSGAIARKPTPIEPPYISYDFEYPPLVGLIFHFASLTGNELVYRMIVVAVFFALYVMMIPSLNQLAPGRWRYVWMLMPTFLLFSSNSWMSIPAVLTYISSILLFCWKTSLSGMFLALASSSGVYPMLILPAMMIHVRRDRARFFSSFLLTFLIVNVPFALINAGRWLRSYLSNFLLFFYDYSLWRTLGLGPETSVPLSATFIFVAVLASLIVGRIFFETNTLYFTAIELLTIIAFSLSYYPASLLMLLPFLSISGLNVTYLLAFDLINLSSGLISLASIRPLIIISKTFFLIGMAAQLPAICSVSGADVMIVPDELKRMAKYVLDTTRRVLKDDRKIVLILFVLSLVVLLYRVWEPSKIYFDEIYYVDQGARSILNRTGDKNWIHPPLGKELIALGIAAFSDVPFSWRIFGVLLASLSIACTYLLVLRVTRSRRVALLVSLLVFTDPLFYTTSRIAMLDVYVFSFSVIAMLFFVYYYFGNRELKYLYLSGMTFGLAVSSKLPGALPMILALFSILSDAVRERNFRLIGHLLLSFVIIPLGIYLSSYYPALFAAGKGLGDFMNTQRWMLTYSAYLPPKQPHPYRSQPWEWPLMSRPLLTLYDVITVNHETYVASICEFGNPLSWYGGLIAVATALVDLMYSRNGTKWFFISWFAITWLPYFPMGVMLYFSSGREMFIYYFLQSLPPLFAILSMELDGLDRYLGWSASALLLVFSVVFFALSYPVISGLPVPKRYVDNMRIMRLG